MLANNNQPVKTVYYSGIYEEAITGTTTRKMHYIYAGDGLAAIYVKNGTSDTLYYVHKDYLGSMDALTNDKNTVVQYMSFDPCSVKHGFCEARAKTDVELIPTRSRCREGRRRNPTNWTFTSVPSNYVTDRGYTGHEHMDKFGLINMNGRVYNPVLGRFHNPDPVITGAGGTQSWNRYSYVLNNPLKYTDPSGYIPREKWDIERNMRVSRRMEIMGLLNSGSLNNAFDRANAYSHNYYLGNADPFTVANHLWNSPYGGSWSRETGIHYFESHEQALLARILYNNLHNSWRHTVHHSPAATIAAYASESSLTTSLDGGNTDYTYKKIASVFRNTYWLGLNENPFFFAEAIYFDIGGSFVGAELDAGYFFILVGNDAGTLQSYGEGPAGGASYDLSAGIEIGRVDISGNPDEITADFFYGFRSKGSVSLGYIGGSYSWGKYKGESVTSKAIHFGIGIFQFVPAFNYGEIKKF